MNTEPTERGGTIDVASAMGFPAEERCQVQISESFIVAFDNMKNWPNWFHRKMMWVVFGWKWTKLQ